MDKDQLSQFIRSEAHAIDMATKCDDKDGGRDAYASLKILLNAWVENDYPAGPDIGWAKKMLKRYTLWCSKDGKYITLPKSTVAGHYEEYEQGIFAVIRNRRSIRFWKKQPVLRADIEKIIESALYAPSAFHKMPYHFYVVENIPVAIIEGDSSNESLLQKAPIKIYVAIDERFYGEKNAPALDAGMAIQNMLLAAHALGLGACVMYQCELVDQRRLRRLLQAPDYHMVYCVVVLGHPNEVPIPPGRARVRDVTSYM
ncbi:nitroreductase family protein [Desulfosediminicola ganghwensis]|uniref:nitroreductase family protein n=1 Tax=Desulfosediminicola ganghwensis TaxID=2569540 RepID=UPI0010ACD025|nr:nitroreductase family protein [Desulfosediminicola ganghwensis]